MAADDDKKLILARRARFVAAALAGVSVACGKEPSQPPQPCLSVPVQRDADANEPPPQPCLSPMEPPADAGEPTPTDAGSSTTTTTKQQQGDAGMPPKPVPCLAPPLPTQPPPRPCLSVVKPPDKQSKQ